MSGLFAVTYYYYYYIITIIVMRWNYVI
jgi:hypothetical protein